VLENLNAIEKHVFRSYWDDGLLDLFAAVGVLGIGLLWLHGIPAAAAIVPALLASLWVPARRRYIEPRLGLIEFSAQRERHNRRLLKLVLYTGIGCLILALEVFFHRDALNAQLAVRLSAGLPAVILALLAAITAFLVSAPRFLAYAAVLVVAAFAGSAQGWLPGQILTAAGAAVMAAAVVVLLRFCRDNPLPPRGME